MMPVPSYQLLLFLAWLHRCGIRRAPGEAERYADQHKMRR